MAFSQILVVLLGMPFLRLLSSRHYIFKQSIDFSISWPAESSGVLLTQQGAHAVVFLRAFFVCSAQLFTWGGENGGCLQRTCPSLANMCKF